MSLMLDKDEYFSLNAYVETPGEQTFALRGYLVDRRADGTYIAPLLPEMFYGADGHQLIGSWRQNLTATGDQVILSRSGGSPTLPRQEIGWRKISGNNVTKQQAQTQLAMVQPIALVGSWWPVVAIVGIIVGGIVVYKLVK
jgi:hypothetical protein